MERCWNYEPKMLDQLLKKCSKKSEHAWKEWKESFSKFSLANGSCKLEQGNFRINKVIIFFFLNHWMGSIANGDEIGKISKLDDRSMEITQFQQESKMIKKKKTVSERCGTMIKYLTFF